MTKTLSELIESNQELTKARDDLMDSPIQNTAELKIKLLEIKPLKDSSSEDIQTIDSVLPLIQINRNAALLSERNAHTSLANIEAKTGYNTVVDTLQLNSRKYVLPQNVLDLPLRGSLNINNGEGKKYQIDVSVPQDNSIMVDTPYVVAEVKGTTTFGSEGLHLSSKDTLLFNSQNIDKGCISFEQGDQIFTDAVTGNQVINADTKGVAEWTLNYNGTNSYVGFPEWRAEGEFEIECDVYYLKRGNWEHILSGTSHRIAFTPTKIEVRPVQDNVTTFINGIEGVAPALGLNKFKAHSLVGATYDLIGIKAGGTEAFKGQISNLKLIDKENPDNSRFYSGIIYSYVDSNAVDVPMPRCTALQDKWCIGIKSFPNLDTVTDADNAYEKLSATSFTIVRNTASAEVTFTDFRVVAGKTYTLVFDSDMPIASEITGTYKRIASGEVFKAPANKQLMIWPSSPNTTVVVSNLHLEEVTHGILYDFGSNQPYVPLLGDREEYCGNHTVENAYTRGTHLILGILVGGGGSFHLNAHNVAPKGSIIIANNTTFVSTTEAENPHNITVDVQQPWEEYRKHFQYPNTFKVIKPTNIDYNTSAPADWAEYTPNFNGVNSYIEIPEWVAQNYLIEFEIAPAALASASQGSTLFGKVGVAHWVNYRYGKFEFNLTGGRIDIASPVGKTVTISMSRTKIIVGGVSYKVKQTMFPFTFIGAYGSAGHNFKGHLYNLRLTDLDNPDNSLFYPLIQKGITMPKITQATEMLQGKHGTMYNFGETKPWIKMVDLSKMDVFPFKPPVSKIEIHHNGSDTEVHMQSQGEWNEMMNNLNMWYIQDTTDVTCNNHVVKDAGWLSNAQGYSAYNATLEGINLGINVGDLLTFMRPKGN